MLQRLFIFLLIFLILPDIYLYLRFIVHLTAKRWLRILYWLPAFLLSTGLLYLVYFSNNAFAERHTQAIGWFSIFFFLFTAPKLLLSLCTIIGVPFHKWLRGAPNSLYLYRADISRDFYRNDHLRVFYRTHAV